MYQCVRLVGGGQPYTKDITILMETDKLYSYKLSSCGSHSLFFNFLLLRIVNKMNVRLKWP